MTKIQVDQVNDHLDLILELQKENELLKVSSETDLLSTTQPRCQKIATLQKQQQQQFPYSNSNYGNLDFNSSTSQLCNTAQVKKTSTDCVSVYSSINYRLQIKQYLRRSIPVRRILMSLFKESM